MQDYSATVALLLGSGEHHRWLRFWKGQQAATDVGFCCQSAGVVTACIPSRLGPVLEGGCESEGST